MNVKQLIAVAALAAVSGTVLAQGDEVVVNPASAVSVYSRPQVKADAASAVAAGDTQYGEAVQEALPVSGAALPRAAVKAQVLQARAQGENLAGGELLGFEAAAPAARGAHRTLVALAR